MPKKHQKIILLALGGFLLPFLGFLFIYNSRLGQIFFHNHIFHTILLFVISISAFYLAYLAGKVYLKIQDLRTFIIGIAFYIFGFVFFLHTFTIPDLSFKFSWLNWVIFDITEHYGLFLGSLAFFALIFPLEGMRKAIYKNRLRIFAGVVLSLLLAVLALIKFPSFAESLEALIDIPIGLTAAMFFVTLVFLLSRYMEKPNILLLHFILGFSILISSGIIPFFYEEWNALWWYYHLVVFSGFGIIAVGLIKSQQKEKGFESVFKEMPFYTSIRTKLGIIFVLIFIFLAAIFFIVGYFQNLQKSDGDIIDISGRNRMLSQHLGFYAEQVLDGKEEARVILKEVIQLHDLSFRLLKDGGVIPGVEGDRVLPPTVSRIMPVVLETEKSWNKYKERAEIIVNEPTFIKGVLNPAVREAMDFIEQNSAEMMEKNDKMVRAYVKMSEEKHTNLTFALRAILIINILIIGAGFLITYLILKPIKILTEASKMISEGNLEARAEVKSKDEIGVLAKNFNRMAENLIEARRLPENILQSMKESLFVVDTKGNITEINPAALEALGYKKEELMGQPISKVFSKKAVKEEDKEQKKKVIKYIPVSEEESINQ